MKSFSGFSKDFRSLKTDSQFRICESMLFFLQVVRRARMPDNILAHSVGKNSNGTACKWKVSFSVINMWPVYQYIMSVVVAVVLLWMQLQYTASISGWQNKNRAHHSGWGTKWWIYHESCKSLFFSKSSNWDKWSLNCILKKKKLHSEKEENSCK